MAPWFLWTLLAVISWGLWAILFKLIGSSLSAAHSQALSTVGLIPVMVALAFSGRLTVSGNRWRGVVLALAAGVLTCAGNAAYYDLLSRGAKAATVIPLTALYPLVTVALAVTMLKERLNRIQVAGMVLSLISIFLFNVQAGQGIAASSLGWVFAPIGLWGLAALLQKISTNHVSGELATLSFLAAFVPVAAAILLRNPLPGGVALKSWLLVAALGLFLALGNFALLAAFAAGGKASVIAPIAGLYPVVSVPIAILFFGERVGRQEGVGILLALASVAALSWENPTVPNPAGKQA